MESFNERLRHLRTAGGLSQKDLSRILGVGQATIASYESGERFPSPMLLYRIAEYFDVSTDFLYGRVELQQEKILQLDEEQMAALQEECLGYAFKGDRFNATLLTTRLMESGVPVPRIYTEIYAPCLKWIDVQLEAGEIPLYRARLMTRLIERLAVQAYPFYAVRELEGPLVVTCGMPDAQADLHARMMADYCEMNGYPALYLENGLPIEAIREAIRGEQAVVVSISSFHIAEPDQLRERILSLRQGKNLPPFDVMLGGRIVASLEEAKVLGADLFGADFDQCLEQIQLKAPGDARCALDGDSQ